MNNDCLGEITDQILILANPCVCVGGMDVGQLILNDVINYNSSIISWQ